MATPTQNEDNIREKFEAAVEIVQNMPKEGPVTSSTEEKLAFYSLFKQATVGPCNISKPGFWNVVEKYKWDSWYALGDMSKEEAMQKYLRRLLEKIDYVNQTNNTNDWINGDGELHDRLQPKFALIGRPDNGKVETPSSTDSSASLEVVTSSSSTDHHPRTYAEVAMAQGLPTPPPTTTSALSDAEYCDAIEDEDQISRSRSSSYEMHDDSPRSMRRNGRKEEMKTYCGRLEGELKKISDQIEKLSNAMEQKHSTLLGVFKKATVYMFVPKGVSWRTVVFFLFWPFIAHFLIRYFKRFLPIKI